MPWHRMSCQQPPCQPTVHHSAATPILTCLLLQPAAVGTGGHQIVSCLWKPSWISSIIAAFKHVTGTLAAEIREQMRI